MNTNSKEFFINLKPREIPFWNPLYGFEEQDDDVKQFWDNEANKLINGVTINGVFIHPWLYWHLNFWNMMLDKGEDRVPGLSELRDNEWLFAEILQQAEQENKGIFMFGTRRFGKALLDSEIVYCEDHEKKIGDVSVGDYIYDDSGHLTEVTGVYPQGKVMTYRVTFEDGRNAICCGEHLWKVKTGGKWTVKKLKEISMLDYKSMSIPICKPIDYPNSKLPIPASAYGSMLASYLTGYIDDVPYDYRILRSFLRSSIKQKETFINSFIKSLNGVVTGNEEFVINTGDMNIIKFVLRMFWSSGWYSKLDGNKLILSNTLDSVKISSIDVYGKYTATCITVNNESKLFLTTNYIVTHNTAIMSSFLARNATMTYNLTHNVIGGSKEDLMSLSEYLEFGLDNIHPYLKINRTGNDWFKEVIMGVKNVRNERDVHARIRITNIDQGKTSSSLKTAGGTPYTSIYDEVGKFPFLSAYLAGKPAHMMKGRMRGMILAAGCVCAGSIVYKANGEPCKIEDLKQDDGIIGFDINTGNISIESITWMKPPEKKECLRITTKSGRILECSTDHPILTVINKRYGDFRYYGSDFRRADFLKKGKRICISDGMDIWGNKHMFDPYLVGILIGDGSYGFDKTPIVSTSDNEVYDYIHDRYKCVIENEYYTKNGKEYKEIRISGICKHLRDLGIYGQVGRNKTIPFNIYQYDKYSIIQLIKGYFDADATFYYGKGKSHDSINVYSCSKELLISVQKILFKLGIYCRINKSKSRNPKDRNIVIDGYKLDISDKTSILRYCDIIGSNIKYRRELLNKIRNNSLEFNTRGSKRSKYIDGVILDVIDRVENIGFKDVYNLTASGTHTYIVNDIITHNTGGNVDRSQDAQKVMNDPASYDFVVMNYDLLNKRAITPTWRICKSGCFVPGQMSHAYEKKKETLDEYLGIKNATGLRKIPIYVTDFEKSTELIKQKREELSKKDKELFVNEKMAYPLTIDDCFLNTNVNRFPVEDALIHKSRLLEEGRRGKIVDIYKIGSNKIGWNFSDKQLAPYPFKGGNIDAPVVIYEDPPEEGGKFDYTYVSGADPFKNEKADTDSLGAFYVLKRLVHINDPFAYKIVASYVSRPAKSDDFCRTCEDLIEAYGAKCLMENADRLFELYLTRRHKEMILLEDGEKLANRIIRPGTRQNNKLGLSPTVPNQRMLFSAVLQYCWEEIIAGYDEEGNEIKQKGIYRIDDIELLDEIIAFGPGVNTDRIIAFGHALLLARYYDDMNFMPESTVNKYNEAVRKKRKIEQYKGFVLRRHNPFKMR